VYGSEVWSLYDKEDAKTWEKDDIEKTYIFANNFEFLG